MNKLLLVIAYLGVFSGLLYTDDLYQNNDERQLISNDSGYEKHRKDYIITLIDGHNDHRPSLRRIIGEYSSDFKIFGPHDISKKDSENEMELFFKKHHLLDLSLITDKRNAYILKLNDFEKRKYPVLFKSIVETFPQVKISGLPYLNYEIGNTTFEIKEKVLPILLGISFCLLLFLTNSIASSVTLFLFPLSSIPLSLILIKFIYGESNLLSSLSPLICFVVIFCLIIHLYYSSFTFKSFEKVQEHKFRPIVFMLLTTVFGVLSLIVSHVPAVRSFSIVTSLALIISSSYSLFLYRKIHIGLGPELTKLKTWSLSPLTLGNRSIAFFLIAPLVIFIFVKDHIPLQVEALHFFPKDFKIVQDTQYIEKSIIGTPVLNIELGKSDILGNYDEIQKIGKLEAKIKEIFGESSVVMSDIQRVRNGNYVYSGHKIIPDNKFAFNVILAKTPKLTEYENYTIEIFGHSMKTQEYFKRLEIVSNLLNKNGIKFRFFGNYYSLMSSQSEIISTLFKSFVLSLTFVSIFIGLYLKSVKNFVVFLLINLLPPVCTLVMFYLFGLSLNLATIMTFSISFGLIVDSTVHVIYGSIEDLSEKDKQSGIYMPILVSSLVLMLGFLSFVTHYFLPIWQFGLSLFFTILFGFLYDFFILTNINFLKNREN